MTSCIIIYEILSSETGGKVEIPELKSQPHFNKPLKPVQAASTAATIVHLLSGEEGKQNAASLDSYMQSQVNPLASTIIKTCLPHGLAVPFPANVSINQRCPITCD